MAILDDLREGIAPITSPDFDTYLQAIASMFAQTEFFSLDSVDLEGNEAPGWSVLLDVERCPFEALGWLAQPVGETLPTTASDPQARQQIRDQPRRRRGTPAGITAAVRLTLSNDDGSIGNPDGTVFFIERSSTACPSEPAYGLTVGVLASQCPDPDATEAAIRSNLPGGIILEFVVSDDVIWDEATLAWNAVSGTVTWNAVAFGDVT